QKALEIDPSSEDAVTNLAYLYSEEGNSEKAIRTLEAVPEAARSAKIYAALGFTHERQGDYKNAITAYHKAVELDRDNLDSLRGLAQNLYSGGQTEAALEQYRNIAEADPRDAQSYLRIAEILRRSGKFDQAQESLKKAEEVAPDSLEVPYNLALVEEARGNFDQAVSILRGLLEKTAKTDDSYTTSERNNRAIFLERLGSIYRDTQKTQEALAVFNQLLALGESFAPRAYQQIIETHRSAREWAEAVRVAREAAEKLPGDRSLQFQLAGQLAEQGQAEDALARVQAFLKGGPEDREVYVALAQVNSRLKRWKEAEDAVAQAEKLSTKPEEHRFLQFLLGSYYERQKKYDRAEAMFRQVLASEAGNAMALNYLGYMLADRGVRLDEALGYIKKAVEQDPQNGAYLDSLGWAYFKMGNHELGEEFLLKAIERMPGDPTIHDHLGDLYARTGRLKLASAQWELSLEAWNRSAPPDVDAVEVAKVQKKLENAKVRLARQSSAQK
ncbi:MAG: tetratricopeptide repeat protein, partial [Terriglobales bacterium]